MFDSAWHRRALSGESEAVSLLADRVLRPLFRFCYHRLGRNQVLTEDVVQETLLVAIERLEGYQPERAGGNIWGWVTGIARNEIRRVLRRAEQGVSLQQYWESTDLRLLEALQNIESEVVAEEVLLRQETCDLVNLAMSQLPVHYQRALIAKYIHGNSLRQIAAVSGASIEAVESLLGRARRAFRKAFQVLSRPMDVGVSGTLGDLLGGGAPNET